MTFRFGLRQLAACHQGIKDRGHGIILIKPRDLAFPLQELREITSTDPADRPAADMGANQSAAHVGKFRHKLNGFGQSLLRCLQDRTQPRRAGGGRVAAETLNRSLTAYIAGDMPAHAIGKHDRDGTAIFKRHGQMGILLTVTLADEFGIGIVD